MAKVSKQQANYRARGGDEPCKTCTMFLPPDACSLVEGEISPQATCDYYRRKRAKSVAD